MRHLLLSLTLLAFSFSLAPSAAAQSEGYGFGGVISTSNTGGLAPVGVAFKGWVTDRQAVAATTSFFVADESFSFWILQGDYLFHNFQQLSVDEGLLGLYVGPGVQFTIIEDFDNDFALRVPVGVNYLFDSAPVDLFLEIAPTLQVTEPTALRFDGAIGFRYFFNPGGSESDS